MISKKSLEQNIESQELLVDEIEQEIEEAENRYDIETARLQKMRQALRQLIAEEENT